MEGLFLYLRHKIILAPAAQSIQFRNAHGLLELEEEQKINLMKAPYLKKIYMHPNSTPDDAYPLSLPMFRDPEFSMEFKTPITIITGENGSGKSTLLESIADHCGFNLTSGNRNHILEENNDVSPLTQALRFSWALKVNQGFFMRAESVYNFAAYLDGMAKENGP